MNEYILSHRHVYCEIWTFERIEAPLYMNLNHPTLPLENNSTRSGSGSSSIAVEKKSHTRVQPLSSDLVLSKDQSTWLQHRLQRRIIRWRWWFPLLDYLMEDEEKNLLSPFTLTTIYDKYGMEGRPVEYQHQWGQVEPVESVRQDDDKENNLPSTNGIGTGTGGKRGKISLTHACLIDRLYFVLYTPNTHLTLTQKTQERESGRETEGNNGTTRIEEKRNDRLPSSMQHTSPTGKDMIETML